MVALPDERLLRKAENAQALGPLAQDERFLRLKEVVTKKRDKTVEAVARAILAGVPFDQRRIDYERGYWDGAMHVLNRPENAVNEFEKALKRLEEGTDV